MTLQLTTPVLHRVIDVIYDRAGDKKAVQISHRQIGHLIGSSTGVISKVIHQLEAAGYIAREPLKQGRVLIRILKPRPVEVTHVEYTPKTDALSAQEVARAEYASKADALLAQLERLVKLKQRGLLTDDEFSALKQKIISE